MFERTKPYNDLPLLPPKAELETKTVLKKCILARSALSELKGLGDIIPNQTILVNSLTLQEAKDSSEIENVVTTNDALFRAFTASTSKVDPQTKEVLRYREALWNGYLSLQKKPILNTNLFIEIVQTIKKNTAGIRNTPRTRIERPATDEVIYTPPEGETVIRDLLKNLEDYIHNDGSVDPLIKLAVLHYQFETIHPFYDGNGRTGRILNILYLNQCGLLDLPILYLSRYIIENKNKYYTKLRNLTEKQTWQDWILYMLDGVEQTAVNTKKRVQEIRELMDKSITFCRENLPMRVYSKELIELLFHQPYIKGKMVVDAGIAKRQTAADYLKELEKVGILKSNKVGKEMVYINTMLYELLSE